MTDYTLDTPQSFDEYVVSEQMRPALTGLQEEMAVALKEGRPLSSVLITGPSGCGKTALGKVILKSMRYKIFETLGANITTNENLFQCLTKIFEKKKEGKVKTPSWLIDEIHGMQKTSVVNTMYKVMTQEPFEITIGSGRRKETKQVVAPPFTIIGCTTDTGKVKGPLRNRFGIRVPVFPLSTEDLAKVIVQFFGRVNMEIEAEAATSIASRAFGIARVALNLSKQVVNALKYRDKLTAEYDLVESILYNDRKITHEGFTYTHYQYLKFIATVPSAGIDNIATVICADRTELIDQIEPQMIMYGLLTRGTGGRCITQKGIERIKSLAAFFGEEAPELNTTSSSGSRLVNILTLGEDDAE